MHHFGNEIGSHANAADQGDYLKYANDFEGCTESAIVGSSHIVGLKMDYERECDIMLKACKSSGCCVRLSIECKEQV